ncbi:hypothetical protein GCM10009789_38750 [Kribbella sancticallisti]|uniref:Uncharacterized protein n=1 Tax=Kribbella sancticallisti TaxID=460087 RepID=A0ABP4PKX1_9ACTN
MVCEAAKYVPIVLWWEAKAMSSRTVVVRVGFSTENGSGPQPDSGGRASAIVISYLFGISPRTVYTWAQYSQDSRAFDLAVDTQPMISSQLPGRGQRVIVLSTLPVLS